MPSRRMIDPAFWQSETVAHLPIEIRYFFIGLFSNADDQGRMKAHPALLRSKLYPYDDINLEDIEDWLDLLVEGQFIVVYILDAKSYVQIVNWWKYQHPRWAWPSEYPAPPEWQDRVHYRQGNKVITQNWDHSEATASDESSDDEPTAEPPRAQNGTTVEPAPSISGSISTSISGSGSTSIMGASAPDADADADALTVYVATLLSSFGMDQPETVAREAAPYGYSTTEIRALIDHADQHNLGPGWLRGELRAGRRAPPARPDPKADSHRYVTGKFAEFIQS